MSNYLLTTILTLSTLFFGSLCYAINDAPQGEQSAVARKDITKEVFCIFGNPGHDIERLRYMVSESRSLTTIRGETMNTDNNGL